MERSDRIYTIPGSFGWDDVGNWLALSRVNNTNDQGNMVRGDVITIDTEDSIIMGDKKLIAVFCNLKNAPKSAEIFYFTASDR
jgi:mannose-1-phosphate guanylyltransferase